MRYNEKKYHINDSNVHEAEFDDPVTMFAFFSDKDSYFGGIIISDSIEDARARAFNLFKKSRKYDWAEYHTSADELIVKCIGLEYMNCVESCIKLTLAAATADV